jgi:hypothetical protein
MISTVESPSSTKNVSEYPPWHALYLNVVVDISPVNFYNRAIIFDFPCYSYFVHFVKIFAIKINFAIIKNNYNAYCVVIFNINEF